MSRVTAVVAMMLLLAGCAKPGPVTYSRPDMSLHSVDHYECRRSATFVAVTGIGRFTSTGLHVDEGLYRDCMASRGYVAGTGVPNPF